MSHPRVFVKPDAVCDESITITGDAYHHLAVVLRADPGDRFCAVLADEETEYLTEITEITADTLTGRIIGTRAPEREASVEITLYQGLPKRTRFKMVLQKCTELGVQRIVPVITERSVIQLSAERARKKVKRWNKICTEAARQSQRVIPTDVAMPMSFPDALEDWNAQIQGLVLDEGLADSEGTGLSDVLRPRGPGDRIALFIGPEGGFTPDETEKARGAGLIPVGLGPRILRTETAAIVACAIVMYEAGELQ